MKSNFYFIPKQINSTSRLKFWNKLSLYLSKSKTATIDEINSMEALLLILL